MNARGCDSSGTGTSSGCDSRAQCQNALFGGVSCKCTAAVEEAVGDDAPATSPCSGWTPPSGKWMGTGGSCAIWGWSMGWCYVAADYRGPGHDLMKASDTYPNIFWMQCIPESGIMCRQRPFLGAFFSQRQARVAVKNPLIPPSPSTQRLKAKTV